MRPLLLVLLVACGSPAPAKPTEPTTRSQVALPPGTLAAITAPPPAGGSPTPEGVCNRLLQLQSEQCGGVFGVKITKTKEECLDMFAQPPADKVQQEQRDKFGGCFMQATCPDVMQCLGALSEPAAADLRTCEDTEHLGAVAVPRDEYVKHNGSSFKYFDEAVSTKEKPIEICGIETENTWLETLQCRDGSTPLAGGHAEDVRVGNVGPGGRCHSIIDFYSVTCGRSKSDIYIDAYVCPK